MTRTVAPATSLRSSCRGIMPSKKASTSSFTSGCGAGGGVVGGVFDSAGVRTVVGCWATAVCGARTTAERNVQTIRWDETRLGRIITHPVKRNVSESFLETPQASNRNLSSAQELSAEGTVEGRRQKVL